ncbi:unnamed protein product, partial [Effrenium voratum]
SNMGAALGCYERALSRAPTSTTAVVAGSLGFLGDALAQRVEQRRPDCVDTTFNVQRNPIIYLPTFYGFNGLYRGQDIDALLAKVRGEYADCLLYVWKVWIPMSVGIFAFVPTRHQAAANFLGNLVWNTLLSLFYNESPQPNVLKAKEAPSRQLAFCYQGMIHHENRLKVFRCAKGMRWLALNHLQVRWRAASTMAKRLPRHRQLRSESSEQKVETKEMEDDQKRQGKERHAEPVHKGSARRAPEAAKPAGEISEAGRLPEWLFEDRPVWLEALVRFLHEPDLLLVRLERGSSQRVARRPAAGVLPEMQELSLPFEKLRSWATGELQQAADEGRKVRSVAVCGTDKSHAADAVEVLRSMGFKRVANVHTQAFLQQLQAM